MFALNQSHNIISVCMSLTTLFNFGTGLYKIVSSANDTQSLLMKLSCKSFMNI